ncbi:hypothetical protein B0H14DRAFT_2602774 [Mycena olivaceomarginata]|nr:hypothetical protein B0H14DRAFT_2602774 [Mycena olivaceomarginata]
MVAIPPRRLAQLRPGADLGMINASHKHGARTFLLVRNFPLEAQATPRLPQICHATPTTWHHLRRHARAGAVGAQALPFRRSRYEEKLLAGMGSEIRAGKYLYSPLLGTRNEERGGCGRHEQRIAFTRGVDTHLGSGRGCPLYGGVAEGGKEHFRRRQRRGGWWEKERGGTNVWQFGQYLLPRSMIAEHILDTLPTVGKCVELSREHSIIKASGVCVKNLPEMREIGILHQPLNFGLRREHPSVLQGLSVGMIIP